jgi:hypothetical protein
MLYNKNPFNPYSNASLFMPNFQKLQNILEMDFTQLRALEGSGGKRATDAAIHLFVNNLVEFYSQFITSPTAEQLKTYKLYMEEITNKINAIEYAYYLDKYTAECPEEAVRMASACLLQTFKDIPKRMQYWAASDEFGGTVRNAKNHVTAVKNLDKWAAFPECCPHSFFQSKESVGKNEAPALTYANGF